MKIRQLLSLLLFALLLLTSGCAARNAHQRAEDALSRVEATGIKGYELAIEVEPHRTLVEGTVASLRDKELALVAIKQDPAIRNIKDQVVVREAVRGSMGAQPTSLELAALRQKILSDVSTQQLVGNLNLQMSTDSANNLIITGNAPSKALASRIAAAARRNWPSANQVNVNIEVPPPVSDPVLKSRIFTALMADPEVDPSRFDLDVNSGLATVTGIFPNHRDIDRILAITLMVDGVQDIRFVSEKPTGINQPVAY